MSVRYSNSAQTTRLSVGDELRRVKFVCEGRKSRNIAPHTGTPSSQLMSSIDSMKRDVKPTKSIPSILCLALGNDIFPAVVRRCEVQNGDRNLSACALVTLSTPEAQTHTHKHTPLEHHRNGVVLFLSIFHRPLVNF